MIGFEKATGAKHGSIFCLLCNQKLFKAELSRHFRNHHWKEWKEGKVFRVTSRLGRGQPLTDRYWRRVET